MSAAPKIIDKRPLQALVPFNALSPMHFNEVAQKTIIEQIGAGRLVFKEGDQDNQSVYLLEGEVSLMSGNELVGTVKAGTEASRNPIAQQQPRQVSVRAKTAVTVARVDSALLDIMLTWDQSSGYEVSEISDEEDDDWMTRILQSQTFLKLPPSNIQRLLMRVESMPVRAGETIIEQDGEGDYFYIIKNGRCMVTRRPSANAKEVKLAELADGDAFGEDALVSDAKRNATITMMTDGVLMRLAKKDFVELLKEPLLNKLDYAEAAALVAQGAEWLDVRLPGEYENLHIKGSRNIPLSALRLEANGLSDATKYVVCCETGRRSASAAFVLSQRGFEVYVLGDGFSRVPAEALDGASLASAAAAAPQSAAVVDIRAPSAPAASAVADETVQALRDSLEALTRDKQTLEASQSQLAARINGLQEELERVREDARDQVLELEQNLAESRQESAAARDELKAQQAALSRKQQADADVLNQAELLEAELAERREHELELQQQLQALQSRVAELDKACAQDAQWRETALAEQAQLQVRIEALQPQAAQAEQHLARIRELELALQEAGSKGEQSQSEQAQRVADLEAALAAANADLEQQRQAVEQQQLALQAEQTRAAEQNDALTQQLSALQSQLATLEQERSAAQTHGETQLQTVAALETRIGSLEQALADATAASSEAQAQHDATQARIDELNSSLADARDAQSRQSEAAQAEADQLRAELDAAQAARAEIAAEHEVLLKQRDEATAAQQTLQDALAQAQSRVAGLEQDAGAQVAQLEQQLAALRQEAEAVERERAALQQDQQQLQQQRDALRASLEQAQARVESLSADSGEQLQRLQSALDTAQRDLQAQQSRLDELTGSQTEATQQLTAAQQLLEETQTALAQAQAETDAARQAHAQAQQVAAEFESRAAQAEQQETEARATLASLQADLAAAQQTAQTQQAQALERVAELERDLAAAQAAAEQAASDAQVDGASLRGELDAATAELQRLRQQQADAASTQDEQTQLLTQLREQLAAAQRQVQETGAARDDFESQLVAAQQAAAQARAELEELQQSQQQRVAEAQTSVRVELEARLEDLRSELDSARTALSRGNEQRDNLQSGLQGELAAARKEFAAALSRAETALDERQEQLAAAESRYRSLSDEHAVLKASTEQQQQSWQAELEQLRMATTADVEALQLRMQQLQDDLAAARKLSSGSGIGDELQRLQILLDQAREEAATARAEAEQLARVAEVEVVGSGEVMALQAQLEEVRQRLEESQLQRESAEEQLVVLRHELDSRAATAAVEPAPAPAYERIEAESAQRGGGLWLGLVAGLVLGALGVAAALWLGKPADELATVASPAAPIAATAADASAPVSVEDKKKDKPSAAAAGTVLTPAVTTAAPAPVSTAVSKGREFRDALGDNASGPQMIEIKAAKYPMGSGASSMDFNERPQRDVELKAFAIGKYEVTFDEFDLFARMTGRALPDDEGRGRGRNPVVNVSWEDATAYVRWLSERTGQRYRLPSEAEWEYAAGKTGLNLYWWGNLPGQGRANCYNCGSEWDAKTTAPVGSFAANALGLHDTSGNVLEWVQDCYHANYDGAPTDGSAWGAAGCTHKVVRGGGYTTPASSLRLTRRDQQIKTMRMDDLGFRVARDL